MEGFWPWALSVGIALCVFWCKGAWHAVRPGTPRTAGFAALTGARRCGPPGLWLQAASKPAGGATRLGSLKRGVGGTLTKMMAAGRKRPLELTKPKRGGAAGGAPRRTGRQVGGPRLSVHAWRV